MKMSICYIVYSVSKLFSEETLKSSQVWPEPAGRKLIVSLGITMVTIYDTAKIFPWNQIFLHVSITKTIITLFMNMISKYLTDFRSAWENTVKMFDEKFR